MFAACLAPVDIAVVLSDFTDLSQDVYPGVYVDFFTNLLYLADLRQSQVRIFVVVTSAVYPSQATVGFYLELDSNQVDVYSRQVLNAQLTIPELFRRIDTEFLVNNGVRYSCLLLNNKYVSILVHCNSHSDFTL